MSKSTMKREQKLFWLLCFRGPKTEVSHCLDMILLKVQLQSLNRPGWRDERSSLAPYQPLCKCNTMRDIFVAGTIQGMRLSIVTLWNRPGLVQKQKQYAACVEGRQQTAVAGNSLPLNIISRSFRSQGSTESQKALVNGVLTHNTMQTVLGNFDSSKNSLTS